MKGEVFIVWGGNWDLAEEVKTLLENDGFIVQVGGIDNDANNSKYFLGDEVIGQIKRASRAIILAESKRPLSFRPNLTWEWGYLSGRLLPSYMHVFLIGIKRSQLFSDLSGTWCAELRSGSVKATAKKVVSEFKAQIKQAQVSPIQVLLNWPTWRQWIDDQASGNVAPDYSLLSGILLHSIQPAFYSGEIQYLKNLVSKLNIDSTLSDELPDAKRICAAACDFYIYTESSSNNISSMMQVADSLSEARSASQASPTTNWINAIRHDFIGLAYRQMAIRTKAAKRKDLYLSSAIDAFNNSLVSLEKLGNNSDPMVTLWRGYVHRNLGRALAAQGNTQPAMKKLTTALTERKWSTGVLRGSGISDMLHMQLLLEIQSVQMDLVEYGYAQNDFAIDEAVEIICEFRRTTGIFGIWKRALEQAESACKGTGRKDLAKLLKSLK